MATTPELRLRDQGSFFVNYTEGRSEHNSDVPIPIFDLDLGASGQITRNQMYVDYQIPAGADRHPPVVLVHGGGHTGACWRSTPDGRQGWATSLVRRGHAVYVVDQVARGRSGFDASPFNRARRSGDGSVVLNVFQFAKETAWSVFRFGPEPGRFYDDSQFPDESLGQYLAQLVPDFNFGMADPLASVGGLAAVLDRIGPAVVVTHSQSGDFGFHLSLRRPDLVKGIVEIEGGSVVDEDEIPGIHTSIPFLTVYGDHVEDQLLYQTTFRAAGALVERLSAAGGDATLVHLPEHGIRGNGHMLMLDRNNEEILDVIESWILDHVSP